MKAQIRAKSRIRRHDWTDLRRLDEKIGYRDLVGLVSGDALAPHDIGLDPRRAGVERKQYGTTPTLEEADPS
jgi:hypothetical protein